MKEINEELKKYIEERVFPQYAKNEEGHGINHIETVINRSMKLSQGYNVNLNIVYTVAAFHDIGHYIDKDKHEEISARMMSEDKNLHKWFSEDELFIIKEAIEDHRASCDREPRSIYGKIISSADRTIIDIDNTIIRTYLYGQKHEKDHTHRQLVKRVYDHLTDKYGEGGYAKCYIRDGEFENALNELRDALSDKEKFLERVEELTARLENDI